MNGGEPTHLDLFSGIGGFALAARWAGFRTIAFSEVDPFCCAVLRKHWPAIPNLGDVRGVRLSSNLLTAGFPCPPFSVAGKRRGEDDDRYLWPETRDAIKAGRPDWFVGENVTGITNMALDDVLSDLEALEYSAVPFVIPAVAVDGAFIGERVWIVAAACGQGLQARRQVSLSTKSVQSMPAGGSVHRRVALPSERQYEWEEPRLVERPMARAVDGVSARLVRLGSRGTIQAFGNAIVPQVAYKILREIRRLI